MSTVTETKLIDATRSFIKQWHEIRPVLQMLVEHKRLFDPTFRMPSIYLEILALENALEKEEQK